MPAGFSAYLDVPGYLRSAANLETASVLGLNTMTGASQPAGTTALTVESAAGWAAGPAWLLDGPASEQVQVTGSPDGSHLTLAAPGTALAHGTGVSVSQGGASGALGEIILRASGWIEGYCRQGSGATDRSLYAAARTERWSMPTSRAYLDRDGVLVVRPGHFPVSSVSVLSVELGQGMSLTFDASQVKLASGGRLVQLPSPLAASPAPGQELLLAAGGLSRARRQWAVITYEAGLSVGALPYDVQLACAWIVSDLLAQRQNPTGAAEVRLGKKALLAHQRGEPTADSLLVRRAKDALEPYKEREP